MSETTLLRTGCWNEFVEFMGEIRQPRVKKLLSSCSYKMVASTSHCESVFLYHSTTVRIKGHKNSGKINRRNLSRSTSFDCRLDRQTNSSAEYHASRRRVNNFRERFEKKFLQYLLSKKTHVKRRWNVNDTIVDLLS